MEVVLVWRWSLVFVLILLLAGCGNISGTEATGNGEVPPAVQVATGKDTYDLILGAYCWDFKNQGVCTDTSGYVHLVKFKDFIKLAPGTNMKFLFPESSGPDAEQLVYSLTDAYEGIEVPIDNHSFTVPDEEGKYYFGYDVKWDGMPGGAVSYAFGIEVVIEGAAGE